MSATTATRLADGTTITVDRVRYHRNGVGGEGFCLVQFRQRDGRRWVPMLATVFDGNGRCAIIDPADPDTCWRGDLYEQTMRDAIAIADLTGEAYQ